VEELRAAAKRKMALAKQIYIQAEYASAQIRFQETLEAASHMREAVVLDHAAEILERETGWPKAALG
jgi:hypothetical protein